MKSCLQIISLFGAILFFGWTGCSHQEQVPAQPDIEKASPGSDNQSTKTEATPMDPKTKAAQFLSAYYNDLSRLEQAQASAYWQTANSGKQEDSDRYAQADLALRSLHADPARYALLKELMTFKDKLNPQEARSLEVAELAFKGNQLPKDLLEKIVKSTATIEHLFNTFRADLDGKKLSNNDLLERLAKETSTPKRKAIWEALKAVGTEVAPKLIELAKVRNQAASTLGYANFWEMQVRLQDHDPKMLLALFDELEKLTDEPFKKMKTAMDMELSRRFKIKLDAMMPWHYNNPFFQAAPPSEKVNLDEFFKTKTKEEIVALGKTFYQDVGIPIDDIIDRSDFYEREGKDQHAFCTTINRLEDVRMLLNVKPTADWMETMLHEAGHAAYYKYIDRTLPYNLREAAHIFSTEAVAMLFGALPGNPTWLVDYAGADAKRVSKVKLAILEQRRREQLIFARWTMVMLNFEKALYENPDQDLNKLWYDLVERFQLLKRPQARNLPDWAAKPHFTIAPVYYHNYFIGELFAAQLRAAFIKLSGHKGPAYELSFKGRKDFGQFLTDKLFKPGMSKLWPEFVNEVTGSPLSSQSFAAEVKD